MEERVTPGQIAKKYGLIYALVSTVINLIPVLMEVAMSAALPMFFVNLAVAFTIFLLAGREYKSLNGGTMGFGEGFKINIIAGAIMAVVRSVVSYVYIKFIDPGYNERIMEGVREMWEQQGMTEEQMEQSSRMMSGFQTPELGLVFGIFFIMLGVLIWGAIAAAITKNEEDEY